MAISGVNGSSNELREHSFSVGIEESCTDDYPRETAVSETCPTHTCSSLHDKDTVLQSSSALSSTSPALNSGMPLLEPFSGQCAVTSDGDSLSANLASTFPTAATQSQASASLSSTCGGEEEKASVLEESALHESEAMLLGVSANLSEQLEILKRMVFERGNHKKEAELGRQEVEHELLVVQQQHKADVENNNAEMKDLKAEIHDLKIQIESYRGHIARLQKELHVCGLEKKCELLKLRSEAAFWRKQAQEREYQCLLAEANLALERRETALMKAECDAYKAELAQLRKKMEDES